MAAVCPVAGAAVYSASKMLNDFVAWGIEYEVSKVGIDVMGWRPGPVMTKFCAYYDGFSSVTPEHYVRCGYSKVTSGVHAGTLTHDLLHALFQNLKDLFMMAPVYFFGKVFSGVKKDKDPKTLGTFEFFQSRQPILEDRPALKNEPKKTK